jgi:hypothetical protein
MTDLSGGETIVELAFPLAGAFLFSHLGSRFCAGQIDFCFWRQAVKTRKEDLRLRLAEGHPKHRVFRSHKVRFGVN